MKTQELLTALRRMKVATGSLICLGCGYEHGCSVHGCAIIREAVARLEQPEVVEQSTEITEGRKNK
ncbi:MAG: hypothetical protein IJ955_06940 [Oscillospiraceae bacterium]|nr:hypothetical protein [Oscillospiraceae bacterium]